MAQELFSIAKKIFILLALLLLISNSTATHASALIFKNQYGSVLELNIGKNSQLQGYFITAVTSKTCPQIKGKKRPVSGFIIGNAFAIAVPYPMCDAVLSITGNMDKDKKMIDTVSIFNLQAKDINNNPGMRLLGHGVYHRINS